VADIKAKDLKLIQYLNEAYGKERQLETALEAHIAMTTRAPYRRRLEKHLRETKAHARDVERRIKQLGGKASDVKVPGPDAVTEGINRAVTVARKSVAALQGPVHVLRGTGEQERLLKNAKTELQDEAEEIATYIAIEHLAKIVRDRETAQLAARIRREEERMRDFLTRQIPQLTKAVATEEIPAAERNGGRRRRSTRRSTGARRRSTSTSRRSSTSTSRRSGTSTSRRSGSTSRTRSAARSASSSRSRPASSRASSSSARSARSRSRSTSSRTRASSSRSRSPASRTRSGRSGPSSSRARSSSGSKR
jgi:ferritin-like metal-binding protein YciE